MRLDGKLRLKRMSRDDVLAYTLQKGKNFPSDSAFSLLYPVIQLNQFQGKNAKLHINTVVAIHSYESKIVVNSTICAQTSEG